MRPIALLPLLLAAAPALAQDPATDPKCATVRVAMPRELAHWSARTPLDAGATTRGAPVVTIGRGVDLKLAAGAVTPVVTPGKPAAADTHGGLALFQVARAGTYRVALGEKAWIDVARARHAVPSTAHKMGPMCTGVAKTVDFRLAPGRYVLQLTGATAETVPVMIVRVK